jgi:hypothetical protein
MNTIFHPLTFFKGMLLISSPDNEVRNSESGNAV